MQGDAIVVEEHHRRAGRGVCEQVLPKLQNNDGGYVITVAGESGSGKSEVAQALADELGKHDFRCAILQQDDYFVYPPRSNDRARRKDITWVGSQEVRLDVLEQNLAEFLGGTTSVVKPLVVYEQDEITQETFDLTGARVVIAEGTYTTLLPNADTRVFIDRTYLETRKHREKRARHESELDPFIDEVLAIEHEIISSHKANADLIITTDYAVSIPV